MVATYGEWDARGDGGAVGGRWWRSFPMGIEVEQREGVGGEEKSCLGVGRQLLTKPKDAREGYWYGPASPSEGWTAVPAEPDPQRTAGE